MKCYYYITVLLFISSSWPLAVAVLDQKRYPVVEILRQRGKAQCCCYGAATVCNLDLAKDIVITNVCSSESSNTLVLNRPARGTIAKIDTNFANRVRHLVIHGGYIQFSEFKIFQQHSSLTILKLNQTQIDQQESPLPTVNSIEIEGTNLDRLPVFNLSYSLSSSQNTIKYVNKLLLDNNQIRNLDIDRTSVGIYSKLQHLSLRGNRISSLAYQILHFTQQLRYLDVSNNTISKIDKTALAHLSQLRSISLKDQRISVPFEFQSDLLDPLLSQIQGRWQLHIQLSQRVYCNCSTAWIQSWIMKPNDHYFVDNYRHIMCSNKVLPDDGNKAIYRVDFSRCLCQQHDCHDPMTSCHYNDINGGFASHRSCKNGYATYLEDTGLRRRCYPSKTASCRHQGTQLICSGNGYQNHLAPEFLGDRSVIYSDIYDNNYVFIRTLHLVGLNFHNQRQLNSTLQLLFSHYYLRIINKVILENCFLPRLDYFPFIDPEYNPHLLEDVIISNCQLQSIVLPPPEVVPRLKRLYLEYNNLSAIPIPPAPYADLKLLVLKNNIIQDIPDSLYHYYPKVRNIDLAYNKIQYIPNHVMDHWYNSDSDTYKFMDLSYNRITKLPSALIQTILYKSDIISRFFHHYVMLPIRLKGNLIPFHDLFTFLRSSMMDSGHCNGLTGQFNSNRSHILFYQQNFLDSYLPCNCQLALMLTPSWIKCLNLTHRCGSEGVLAGRRLDALLSHRCLCSQSDDTSCKPNRYCQESATELTSSCIVKGAVTKPLDSLSYPLSIMNYLPCYNMSQRVTTAPATTPTITSAITSTTKSTATSINTTTSTNTSTNTSFLLTTQTTINSTVWESFANSSSIMPNYRNEITVAGIVIPAILVIIVVLILVYRNYNKWPYSKYNCCSRRNETTQVTLVQNSCYDNNDYNFDLELMD